MELKFRPLRADEIEIRVATSNDRGASFLLYKTARVDSSFLDEVVGALNWQCSFAEIKGNMYCGISIYDEAKAQWITKWNCGTESFSDKEKGEASDSFKRSGFMWGIGTELYTSPFIWVNLNDKEWTVRSGGKKIPKIDLSVSEISVDENKRMTKLVLVDSSGNVRFSFGSNKKPVKQAPKPVEKGKTLSVDELKACSKDSTLLALLKGLVESTGATKYGALETQDQEIIASTLRDKAKEIGVEI